MNNKTNNLNQETNVKDELVCENNVIHEGAVKTVLSTMPDEDVLYDVAELFKIFGDSTRIRILSALSVSELCVCDICAVLNMTKSAVSHQLRILRQAKLVKNKRNGKEIYYSLDDDHVSSIMDLALDHIKE